MGNSDQILYQLLLGRKLLSIHNDEFAVVGFAQMHEQMISEACQSILVSKKQHGHFSRNDGIYQSQKLFPFEIESPANFTDPFIDSITVRFTKRGQYPSLVFQVRLLRHTRYAARGNDPSSHSRFLGENREEVFLRVVSPIRCSSVSFEHPLPIPSLQRLDRNADFSPNSLGVYIYLFYTHLYTLSRASSSLPNRLNKPPTPLDSRAPPPASLRPASCPGGEL